VVNWILTTVSWSYSIMKLLNVDVFKSNQWTFWCSTVYAYIIAYLFIRFIHNSMYQISSLFHLSLKHHMFKYTGQLKKKVTLSHLYNEVTSEPTITRYASIVRKTLIVLICYLMNTQCGNPVSHGTRQSDSPFLSRLSPACPCLWLPQRRWCAVSILEDNLAGVVRRRRPWHNPSRCTVVTELVFANCRIQNAFCCGVTILQHGLPWRRRPETLSRVGYKQTLRVFLTIVYRVIVGWLITSL
jgi:hypothetical protein